MTDFEIILSILNKSEELKEHFSVSKVHLFNKEDSGPIFECDMITITSFADSVDIIFDDKGNIL